MPHKDPEIRKQYQKEYREKNKQLLKEKAESYAALNKEKIDKYQSEYRIKNKLRKEKYDKKRYSSIREKRIAQRANWEKEQRKNNPKFRLNKNISCYIRNSLKENSISKNLIKWEKLVGYTKQQLIEHLERQFKPEMNWDNYGSYWHIDHVKPKSWFNYTSYDDEEFKKCWSLDNLQPLEATKNLTKSNKYIG